MQRMETVNRDTTALLIDVARQKVPGQWLYIHYTWILVREITILTEEMFKFQYATSSLEIRIPNRQKGSEGQACVLGG